MLMNDDKYSNLHTDNMLLLLLSCSLKQRLTRIYEMSLGSWKLKCISFLRARWGKKKLLVQLE